MATKTNKSTQGFEACRELLVGKLEIASNIFSQ